ncbi:MAG: hypothetical protein ABIH69_05065 [bacterium]
MGHPARQTKNRRGAALLLTVFLIAIGAILIIGFLELSLADLQIVRNHQYSTRALYIAEAGIEDAIYELAQNANWNAGFAAKAYAGETYTVVVTEIDAKINVLNSTSTVDGVFQRQIEVQVATSGSSPPVIDYWKEI